MPVVNEVTKGSTGYTPARQRATHIKSVRRAPEEINSVEERGLESDVDDERLQEEKSAVRKSRGLEVRAHFFYLALVANTVLDDRDNPGSEGQEGSRQRR